MRCVASYGFAKTFPKAEPKTFHDWVANQFGERLLSIFFKTYTEKVWGMSCGEISADWAAQRIRGRAFRQRRYMQSASPCGAAGRMR